MSKSLLNAEEFAVISGKGKSLSAGVDSYSKFRQKMNSNIDGRGEFVTRNVLPVQYASRREKCVISVKSLETQRLAAVAGI